MSFIDVSPEAVWIAVLDRVIGLYGDRLSEKKELKLPALASTKSDRILVSSKCGQYVISGFTTKTICIWNATDGVVVACATSSKQPTAFAVLNLSVEKAVLLVSDKGGEVWAFDFPLLRDKVRLFGHTSSIITAMKPTCDSRFIVTSDRDEKLRVTCFPQTACIKSYCLGHKDVVTSFDFLSKSDKGECFARDLSLMVSCSWDNTLMLWDYDKGQLLDVVDLKVNRSKVDRDEETADSVPKDNIQDIAVGVGDDADDEEVKLYDMSKAGNFPLKVCVSQTLPSYLKDPKDCEKYLVAVVFWGLPVVRIYTVSVSDASVAFDRSDPSADITFVSISTQRLPSDITFFTDTITGRLHLFCLLSDPTVSLDISSEVLLDTPDSVECLEMSCDQDLRFIKSFGAAEVTEAPSSFIRASLQSLDLSGDHISQKTVFMDESSPESVQGILKHSLDKPFSKEAMTEVSRCRSKKHKTVS